ncbi:MAG: fibronectin type III domain-containing protein, partial [Bacteroidia bacterium]|nr:fibronectin type III domain-containing protein [Bacteroidia bacterium]
TTYCGYTAQSFGEFIGADSVLTANHYRFQLVNAANSYTQTFTNSSGYPYLTLYTIPGIGYNTTYTVTVAWSADGVSWSPYGSPCSITSPAAEITQLEPGNCGYTALSYPEIIRANAVSGATQYQFKLENAALGYSQSLVKTNNNFNLSQFSGLLNASTYSVSVRVFIFGAWDIYGPVCQLTTPTGVPTTSLQASSCGVTVSSYPQILFAVPVGAATQYEYKLENAALGYSQTYVKTNNNFNMAQFTGLANATTYSVSVRVNVNNTWGSYGNVCSVTTPAGVPTTSFQPASCGVTVSSYPQILFAESLGAATQYEYKLVNTALGYSQTYVKTNNNFNLAQFTGLLNNTTYSVSVRANVGNTWGSFGTECQVTTPSSIPSTSLQPSYCGMVATAYDQIIFATN